MAQQAFTPGEPVSAEPPPRVLPGPSDREGATRRPERIESPLCTSKWRRGTKRTIDVIGATVSLVLMFPIMVLVSLAIVVDSPGSPIFVHERVGRRGRPFGVMKFRTMSCRDEDGWERKIGADPDLALEWSQTWKVRHDPRVTRIGRWLRKFSVDELPQLLNVLAGHMSLVGPRPVVPGELELFGDTAPTILSVRPGITGLWAVSGRNEVSYEERVQLEASYVDRWTLGRDAAILLRTIPCIVRGRGAY